MFNSLYLILEESLRWNKDFMNTYSTPEIQSDEMFVKEQMTYDYHHKYLYLATIQT